MNLIPKIAEMLGVEIGEEFYVMTSFGKTVHCDSIDNPIRYLFGADGLYKKEESGVTKAYAMLGNLLDGTFEIEKLPFEPARGQEYYKVIVRGGELGAVPETWANWMADYADKYCGNCFRTREEAEREKYNVYKRLTGKEWGE